LCFFLGTWKILEAAQNALLCLQKIQKRCSAQFLGICRCLRRKCVNKDLDTPYTLLRTENATLMNFMKKAFKKTTQISSHRTGWWRSHASALIHFTLGYSFIDLLSLRVNVWNISIDLQTCIFVPYFVHENMVQFKLGDHLEWQEWQIPLSYQTVQTFCLHMSLFDAPHKLY
jgi:hypothetical protein